MPLRGKQLAVVGGNLPRNAGIPKQKRWSTKPPQTGLDVNKQGFKFSQTAGTLKTKCKIKTVFFSKLTEELQKDFNTH